MYTQGLYDDDMPPIDCSKLFGISTMLSSIQILNFSREISKHCLEKLQYAAEFERFSSDKGNIEKNQQPFQNLLFLIRDSVSVYLS